MLGLLFVGQALAGPVRDLADATGGVPIVALSCDRADRIISDDGQLGLAIVTGLPGDETQQVFDRGKPLVVVMNTDEAGVMTLGVEGGVSDPSHVGEQIADPEFQARLPEGGTAIQAGDRIRLRLPQGEGARPSGQPVVDRADGRTEPGCVVAVDAPALFAGAPPPVPLADRVQVIVARMEDTKGTHRVTLEVSEIPPDVADVLDGSGPMGFAGASSTVVFPTVIQVHGPLEEVLRALPSVSQGAVTAVAASLAEDIDGRLVGAPGMLVALGGPEEGGAIVLPLEKPQAPGKLRKVVTKVARTIGADVTRSGGLLSISVPGRPALTAGTEPGLVVVALREDVVRDVLAGVGEPWLPEPSGPYGLRMRGLAAMPGGGFDGYVEAIWAEGAMQVIVEPAR